MQGLVSLAARLDAHADAWEAREKRIEELEAKNVEMGLALAVSTHPALRAALEAEVAELRGRVGSAWQRCPVCEGRGDHMRGFYDGPGPTSSDGTTRVKCHTCNGLAVIVLPAPEPPA
jgi:hypothetical protein